MKFQTRKSYEVSLCQSLGGVPGHFRVCCCCVHTTGIQLEVFTDDSYRHRYRLNICSFIFVELTNTVFVNSANITINIETTVVSNDSSVTFVSAANITCTGCPRKKFPFKYIYIGTTICTDKRMFFRKQRQNQQDDTARAGANDSPPPPASSC